MSDKIVNILRSKVLSYVMILTVIFQISYPLASNGYIYADEISELISAPVSTTDVTACSNCDFGDAPASYGSAGVKAGATISPSAGVVSAPPSDAEIDPQYSDLATGDDASGRDDENGISGSGPTKLYMSVDDPKGTMEISNTLSGTGSVGIWIDLDANGTFDEDEGQIFSGKLGNNVYPYTFNASDVNTAGVDGKGNSFIRIRFLQGTSTTLTTADAATNFPSVTGETEDYQIYFKTGKSYAGYNHLVVSTQDCTSSGNSFYYEGIPYGGSPTGYVDLEIQHSGTGTFSQVCGSYTGWNTQAFNGNISLIAYVDDDGLGGTTFDKKTPIAMNFTFTTNDMDGNKEAFTYPKSKFVLDENFAAEFTHNSAIGLTDDGTNYIVQAFQEGPTVADPVNNGEEYSTAWHTIQTTTDVSNPTTFQENDSNMVINAALSIGGPMVGTFTGFPQESVSPNVTFTEDVQYVAEFGKAKSSNGETFDLVSGVHIDYDDPLIVEDSITSLNLKDSEANVVCSSNDIGSQTTTCGVITISVDADAGAIDITSTKDYSMETVQDYTFDYMVTVEDEMVGTDSDISDPQMNFVSNTGTNGTVIHANTLTIARPVDLGDKVTVDYTLDDKYDSDGDGAYDVQTSADACLPTMKSITPNGCAEHGEILHNTITVSSTIGYDQTLKIKVSELLDSQNALVNGTLNDSDVIIKDQDDNTLVLGTDYTIVSAEEIDFIEPLNKDETFTIEFNTKVNLTGTEATDNSITNSAEVDTTDPIDLNDPDTNVSLTEIVTQEPTIYISWLDDTVNGFDISMTATDTDDQGPVVSGFTPSQAGYAEPNEYISYTVDIVNTGMIDQPNAILDVNAFSDINLDLANALYCIDSSDVGIDCDFSYTAVPTDGLIDLGDLEGEATEETATHVFIKIPTFNTLDYSQSKDVINVQTVTLTTDNGTDIATNVEEIPFVSEDSLLSLTIDKKISDDSPALFSFESIRNATSPTLDGKAQLGEKLYYTITVTNTGNTKLEGVEIVEDLDDNDLSKGTLTNVKVNGKSDMNESVDSTMFKVTVPDTLESGDKIVVTFEINANSSFDDTETIDTTATATTPAFLPTKSTGGGSTTTTVEESTNYVEGETTWDIVKDTKLDPTNPEDIGVTFTKQVTETAMDDNEASVGESLHYTYVITNEATTTKADVPLQNVILTDPLNDVDLNTSSVTNISSTGDALEAKPDITTGINIGNIAPGKSVEVTFDINAAATFDNSEVIDTTSYITADNFKDTTKSSGGPVTTISEDDSLAYEDADINKNMDLDPTNPEDIGVIFTKQVTEVTLDDNEASVNELLHYTYTITNETSTRADVPLQNVILTDPLDDPDLDVDSISGITSTGDALEADPSITDGIKLGNIAAGQTVLVQFDINANSTFDDTDVIDTTSYITADNFNSASKSTGGGISTKKIEEDDSLAYEDADINKNMELSSADGIKFTKQVTEKVEDNHQADVGELLHYRYTITNETTPVTRAAAPIVDATVKDALNDIDLDNTTVTNVTSNVAIDSAQSILTGIDLGTIAPGETVTLEFDVNAASTFDATPIINTTARLTAENLTSPIDEDDSLAYVDPDINKNLDITTGPDSGVTFVKTVTDASSTGTVDNAAQPGEILTYTYVITNNAPLTLKGVKVRDNLSVESDLDASTFSNPVTVSYNDGTPDVAYTVNDVIAGIILGQIPSGQEITLTFDVSANSSFVAANGINSSAVLTSSNFDQPIREDYDATTETYVDHIPDIAQDTTLDPIGPDGTQNVILAKTLIDGDNSGEVDTNEAITYKYDIVNNSDTLMQGAKLRDNLLVEVDLSDIDVTTPITILRADGTIDSTKTVQNVIDGVGLGAIAPGKTATVEFTINADSNFEEANNINSKAVVTAKNMTTPVKEKFENGEYTDNNPDIPQDYMIDPTKPVDPTNPDTSDRVIKFVKTVTDASGDKVQAGEAVTYNYTVTNNADKPLKAAKLKDNLLTEVDLSDIDVTTPITITRGDGTVDATKTVQNVINGLGLGTLLVGQTATVEFTINANNTFLAADGNYAINSAAIVTSANLTETVKEEFESGVYQDHNPDIEEDTSVNPTDPTNGVTFTKVVTDENSTGTVDGIAQPGELLTYTYTITNVNPSATRASVPLTNVVVVDPNLGIEGDLDISTMTTAVASTGETGDITTGITIPTINPGKTVTITFNINAVATFDSTPTINTTATLTSDNVVSTLSSGGTTLSMVEDDSAAGANADIGKDTVSASRNGRLSNNFTIFLPAQAKAFRNKLAGKNSNGIANYLIDYYGIIGYDENGNIVESSTLKGNTIAKGPIKKLDSIDNLKSIDDSNGTFPDPGLYVIRLKYTDSSGVIYTGNQILGVVDPSARSLKPSNNELTRDIDLSTVVSVGDKEYTLSVDQTGITISEILKDENVESDFNIDESGEVSGEGQETEYIQYLFDKIDRKLDDVKEQYEDYKLEI